MKQIYLGLAIHNHQPVGNFPWVFEEAYRQAYAPMLEALLRYPGVRLSLHYSGCLIDWLLANHPEFITRLQHLVARGQVEIIGGGYYEPILTAIPDSDKRGQLEKMNAWVESTFGTRPSGMWLAERVWEPHLALPIANAGIDWTIVDDTHFKMVGLDDRDLFGYYVTEEQGRTLKVYGTSKHLRYVIPWGKVGDVISYLRDEATEDGQKIAVMGDDGEKFGNWPGTYEHCWRKGWVERFFRALESNANWLHTITLGDYARQSRSLGRVYLPTASYAEMMEWALPSQASYEFGQASHALEAAGRKDVIRFLRGGFWRNFLVKYPEVNSMHKKMLWVHDKVWGVEPGAEPNEAALNELWQGQCNCPYWHGVFGGSYMTDIRAEMYRHLITAENAVEGVDDGASWIRAVSTDFDRDGQPEVLVEGNRQNLYFDVLNGGRVFEWDWRPARYNLVSTISRRPEAYHQTLRQYETANAVAVSGGPSGTARNIHETVRTKEPGLAQRLWYDWYERRALIDHFLHPGTTLEGFRQANYGEQGDFADQPYEHEVVEEDGKVSIRLWRDGHVWSGPNWLPVRIEKRVEVAAGSDEVAVHYTVTNQSDIGTDLWFGTESNFNLLGGGGNPVASYHVPNIELEDPHLDSMGELTSISSVGLSNTWLDIGLKLSVSQPAILWRFPIETIGNSEAGFERTYQASCLLFSWRIHLNPGESWQADLRFGCGAAASVL